MANLDLSKYGICNSVEILHNPSYEVLYQEETKEGLEGFEKGQLTELETPREFWIQDFEGFFFKLLLLFCCCCCLLFFGYSV